MQMAIYRSCACLELNKLKSPLKQGRRALRRHPHVIIAGVITVILMAGDCSLGLKTPTLLVPGAAPASKFLRERRS